MRIIEKKVNTRYGEIREIEDTLETWHNIVGGYIETYKLTDDILIVLNEEGKLIGLEPNVYIPAMDYAGESYLECIVGNIAFVGFDDYGNFISLSDDDINFLKFLDLIK